MIAGRRLEDLVKGRGDGFRGRDEVGELGEEKHS